MISGLYLRLAAGAAVLALLGGLWGVWEWQGRQLAVARENAAKWQSAAEGYKAAYAREQAAYRISDKAATRYADASQKVEVRTRTILQEVTKYVSPETDARCFVPVGLVRVWNASVDGTDPGSVPVPAQLPDGAASGIACSELASEIATAFGDFKLNAEQMKALQGWILDHQAAAPNPAPPR